MLIVQNLFNRNKYQRTISLITHYMVLFKNPRDMSQIMALGQQMYPRRTKMLSAHSQTVDETVIGFGDEVFTNTRSRLL
jgi:hypothetical protein